MNYTTVRRYALDILDNINDGVFVTNKKRKIVYWNKAAEEITGKTKKDVLNKSCYEVMNFPQNDQGKCLCENNCPLLSTIKEGKVIKRYKTIFTKGEEKITLEVSTSPIINPLGQVLGGVAVFREIKD
ncbi:PAS sensor domain-containing protein [Carboxydothermus islandicus]|uniref:PAS sensor domain-containing protein n=1 Tax=Carboxydothermus islandicus TaxID=661089 RepID=A0A1L8D5F0_9THEO|nr:PAS domain-containing protein [Carboxydothermus islandicus]GAV26400.1 PAS sensor domain-containing protein [Carboxydothermus islandicus]